MATVDFSCVMRPVTRAGFGIGAATEPTKLSVKLAKLSKAAHTQDPTGELKSESEWVWCVVQETAGQADKFLSGGQSSSMSEASAQAELELQRYEQRLSIKKAGI